MHAFLHDYKAELRAGCVKLANRHAGVASSLFLIRTNGAQYGLIYSVVSITELAVLQPKVGRFFIEIKAKARVESKNYYSART